MGLWLKERWQLKEVVKVLVPKERWERTKGRLFTGRLNNPRVREMVHRMVEARRGERRRRWDEVEREGSERREVYRLDTLLQYWSLACLLRPLRALRALHLLRLLRPLRRLRAAWSRLISSSHSPFQHLSSHITQCIIIHWGCPFISQRYNSLLLLPHHLSPFTLTPPHPSPLTPHPSSSSLTPRCSLFLYIIKGLRASRSTFILSASLSLYLFEFLKFSCFSFIHIFFDGLYIMHEAMT